MAFFLKRFQFFLKAIKGIFIMFTRVVFLITLFFSFSSVADFKVALTQIVSHPSLDKVRDGVLSSFRESNLAIDVIEQTPQGNIAIASQIAKNFVSKDPNVIVAITTPSAQAVVSATKETKIPVVFATVTDPIGAGLVDSLSPQGLVTGTRNTSPLNEIVSLLKKVIPNAKAIGVLINPTEGNSVFLLSEIKKIALDYGVEIIDAPVFNTSNVQTAAQSLIEKVDAVILLQDNTVASALGGLMNVFTKENIPVFSTFLEAFDQGAVACIAYDEFEIGKETGKIVIDILKGKKISDIPVRDPQKIETKINQDLAKKLNLVF